MEYVFIIVSLISYFMHWIGFQSEGYWRQHGKHPSRLKLILIVSIDSQAVNHVIWSTYVAAIPTEHVIQNELSPGSIVMQPTAKAQMSVKDVTVIATPACFIVKPISSSRLSISYKMIRGILARNILNYNIRGSSFIK